MGWDYFVEYGVDDPALYRTCVLESGPHASATAALTFACDQVGKLARDLADRPQFFEEMDRESPLDLPIQGFTIVRYDDDGTDWDWSLSGERRQKGERMDGRLIRGTVTLEVTVDPHEWETSYGTAPEDDPHDVPRHVTETVEDCVTELFAAQANGSALLSAHWKETS